jgi:hypothetical protein
MKRIAALCLSAVVLAACQDEPTRAPDYVPVSLAISDEATDPTVEGFWFFPPLVDSPNRHPDFGASPFNRDLEPFVRICELTAGDGVPAPTDTICERNVGEDLAMELDLANERYYVSWQTSGFDDGDDLDLDRYHRIHVMIGTNTLFGYRDMDFDEGPPQGACTNEDAFCQANLGSTVPIKVRIEADALCPAGTACQTKSTNFGQDEDWVVEGESFYALTVPQQLGTNGTATITVQECFDDNVDELTDLKVYDDGPCLETVHHTDDFDGILAANATASISFCDVDFGASGLPSSARILAVHDDGHHEILREKDSMCDELLSSAPANPLVRLASRIGDRVRSWVGVRPLMASAAVGPRTSRTGDSEDNIRTKWKFVEPLVDNSVDLEVRKALAGTMVLTTATVADFNDLGVTGATLRWNVTQSPAGGADVRSVDNVCDDDPGTSDDAVCTTNGSKNIQVELQLDDQPGTNIFTAHGRDHADPRGVNDCSATFYPPDEPSYTVSNLRCNGPRDGADPFTPIESGEDPNDDIIEDDDEEAEDPIPDDTKLTFTVIGCKFTVDGIEEAGEWGDCATTIPFDANVSGGKVVGELSWARLGGNIYFAVKVPVVTAAEKEIKLTLYLNDDESETFQSGDDVLVVDGTVEEGELQFSDNYLWDRCPKGKSFCALPDLGGPDLGAGAFSINTPEGEDPFYLFEVMQSFSETPNDSHDVNDTGTLEVSLTLRIGKGKWGNTDFPDFGAYEELY